MLTYNPGGATLLTSFFLGAPKCPEGTGQHLASSIVEVVTPFINKSQYAGLSGDGVYKHTGVPQKLDEHFGKECVFTHDLMHVAALVDTSMRNSKSKHAGKFVWLNQLTLAIGAANTFIHWGKEWAHFFKVYSEMVEIGLEERVLCPKSFSDTKMANYVKKVYQRTREIVPALVQTVEEVKQTWVKEGKPSGTADKAMKADSVLSKVHNAVFLLSLSALVDIYTVYSSIACNMQVKTYGQHCMNVYMAPLLCYQ